MKKNGLILSGIIVLLLFAGASYLLFHKSSPSKSSAAAAAKTSTSAPAINNAIVVTKTDAKLGQYLAEPNGQALYTYGADTAGVSKCSGSCLASWPAYQATGSTASLPAGFGTITRSDNGETQYTYNGMPLYTFMSDSAGTITGNGVANFSVAKPAAPAAASQSSTSATSSSDSSSSNW